MLLSVNKDRPWKNLDDLIKFIKANPGKVRLATSGPSATDNIFFHAFLQAVGGGKVTGVPYGGDAPAATALARGECDIAFIPLAGVIAFKDYLRFLAVASEKRIGALPEVPTMIEIGVNFEASSQDGVHGPAGLHPLIVKKVEAAYRKVLSGDEVIKQFGKLFLEPNFMTSEEWQAFVTEWNPRWKALIAELGLENK
jgi:tripartite-type tricarboxylate transporter receptor subunit TctC